MKIPFVWILLAGAAFFLVALLLVPGDSEYVRLAIDAGDYDYAQSLLDRRLKSPDPPVWALRDAAHVAALQGYPSRAVRYLENLLKKSPGEYNDRLELARLYLNLYEPRKAALQLHELLRTEKLPDRDMMRLARSYDILNLPGEALTILHRIANEHPKDMNYWKAILIYDTQTGNADDMARTLRTLSRNFPQRIDYLTMRLSLASRRGRDREVLRMMARLKVLGAGIDTSLLPAMRSLFRMKRPVDAYLLYRTSEPEVAKNSVIDSAAWFFYKSGYLPWSLSAFLDLLAREPTNRKVWDEAIWLSDKLHWYSATRSLMEKRQGVLPLPVELYHQRILDLDERYGLKGRAQADLLLWLGSPGGPDLDDMRLAWQTAEDVDNLPLATARLRQAMNIFPSNGQLRENLVRSYRDMGRYDDAGAFLWAQGLEGGDRSLLRRALAAFREADNVGAQKGILYYLVSSDSRERFRDDQYALFTLFDIGGQPTDVSQLLTALQRFPDLSASMGMELARIMVWGHHDKKAREAIDRIARAYPFNRAILFQASDWFNEADRLDLAIDYDKRLVSLLPSDPQGLALLIRDRIWAGQDKKVLAYYQRLLGLDPRNLPALAYLGDHAYYHGRFRRAIRLYRRAVRYGDTDYALVYRLGSAFRQVKNLRMARRMFRLSWELLSPKLSPPPHSARQRTLSQGLDPPAGQFRLVAQSLGGRPPPSPSGKKDEAYRRRLLYAIKIQHALGHDRVAYRRTLDFLRQFPDDREGLYWAARLLWKAKKGGKALAYLGRWLSRHPDSKDFLVFRAEILTATGRVGAAQRLLWRLHKKYPEDRVIWSDLVETYKKQGDLVSTQALDSHIFSQGETQAPRVTSGILNLYNMGDWSLRNQDFAIFYPGGAAYSFDTKVETPLWDSANYFAGRTEYLGGGSGTGIGTNGYTYAGVRWSPTPGWQVVAEGGDTQLAGTPGFYLRGTGSVGPVTLDLQGFDNMIWGDFGESIARDGLQSGYMATISVAPFQRLSFEAESWLFDYTLDGRMLPFGELHNTLGMFDLVLDTDPSLDFVGGYEDWTMEAASPAIGALVPILDRQQFLFGALVYQAHIQNRMNLNLQVGGYDDIYSHTPSYEGGMGVSYRVSRSLELFANGDYFNQSVLYSGASVEAVWGFSLWF